MNLILKMLINVGPLVILYSNFQINGIESVDIVIRHTRVTSNINRISSIEKNILMKELIK